jgi:hypothetical protein
VIKSQFKLLSSALTLLAFASCSPISNTKYDEYLSLKYELNECNTNFNYSSSTQITGLATFQKRGVNVTTDSGKLKNLFLGNVLANDLPIRYAEVAVYDGSNTIVQCGRTDANGQLRAIDGIGPIEIPAQSGNYTVRVFSRVNKVMALASSSKAEFAANFAVKKDRYTNELYFISATFNSNGVENKNINMKAYARQSDSTEIEGGAFNILNTIYTAYDFIRLNTAEINTTCMNPKLNVYWKAGFNPLQYYYPDTDPRTLDSNSYYLENDDNGPSLFISGGKLGDMSNERTDHFGDYVILHELGHHVEYSCGSLLTPGGTHSLVVRQDARLMWAEAWSNFFAAKVLNLNIDQLDPEFRTQMSNFGITDTSWNYFFGSKGYTDSTENVSNGTGFMFDLRKDGRNPDSWQMGSLIGIPFDQVDPSRYPGEGHFREGAISRGLYKLSTVCGVNNFCIDSVSGAAPITFDLFWKSMDKLTGIGQSDSYPFKSSALFLEKLKLFQLDANPTSWTNFYKNFFASNSFEALQLVSDDSFRSVSGSTYNRWFTFGDYLADSVSAGECTNGKLIIQPRNDDDFLTGKNSDQRYSNHFYTIDLLQLQSLDEITVQFNKLTGTNVEFDLLLFKENYFYNEDQLCSRYDSQKQCLEYSATRTGTDDVIKSDRRSGAINLKQLKNLSALDRNQRYLLNIRAYTAGKSISPSTEYEYIIRNQNGERLCPLEIN